jgi:hypothetical protein
MATSAQIRQQLVEALALDLIGPGWDDVARRHERLPPPLRGSLTATSSPTIPSSASGTLGPGPR